MISMPVHLQSNKELLTGELFKGIHDADDASQPRYGVSHSLSRI